MADLHTKTDLREGCVSVDRGGGKNQVAWSERIDGPILNE